MRCSDAAGDGTGFWRFVGGSAAVEALITALALRYFYVIDRWEAQVGAHARAEVDALQARIRPHFLFNSMNMIASLLRRDPEVAERAVLDLSDLFRAALGAGEGNSTLTEEVQLAERYLDIEQLRLGERLQVEWHKTEPLPWALAMPRLMLQPLLENAVLHHPHRTAGHRRPPAHRGRQSLAAAAGFRCAACRRARRRPRPAQHRPSHRLCLRPAREDGLGVARGLLSLRTRPAADMRTPHR